MSDRSPSPAWQLRQLKELSPRRWQVKLSSSSSQGDPHEFEFNDPIQSAFQEELLRWYFEDFTNEPFAQARALEAETLLGNYRSSILTQLGLSKLQPRSDAEALDILLQITLTPERCGIDRINWEVLEQPTAGCPRIRVQRQLLSPHVADDKTSPHRQQKAFRILALTARSHSTADVTPRLTALPLIGTLSGIPASRHVEAELVRPATFDNLKRSLGAAAPKGGFDLSISTCTETSRKKKGHSAAEVADLISRHGVRWVVLCACRTAVSSNTSSSNLALAFLSHGIRGVLAMRYELKAAAARIITDAFYHALCAEDRPFLESASAARDALMKNRRRKAKYDEMVELQDFCVPASYCLPGARESSLPSTFVLAPGSHTPTVSAPGLFGRENDVERLELMLVKDDPATFVILTGSVGIGKTQMLRHLEWWWQHSNLFQRVIFADAGVAAAGLGLSNNTVGLQALVQIIAESLEAINVVVATNRPVENLVAVSDWMTAKCQNTVLLLDGIDELYRIGCSTTDTREDWHEFLRAAQQMSKKAAIVMAMTKTDQLVPPDLQSCIFKMQDTMLQSAAVSLIHHWRADINFSASNSEPDGYLKNVLSLLSHNPTAMKCHMDGFAEPFSGLGKLLDWSSRSPDSRISPYLGESGRAEATIWRVIYDLYEDGRCLDVFGLLLLGMFTQVIPDFDSLQLLISEVDEFLEPYENFDRYFAPCEDFDDLGPPCGIPFELWQYMQLPGHEPTGDLEGAVANALGLLRAAGLAELRTGDILDGQRFYVINPCATQSLRDILVLLIPPLSLFVLLELFKKYEEDRAHRMTRLTKDISVRSGLREYAPLVRTERFNLLSVILHSLNDQLTPDPAPCNQVPIESLYVVWPSSLGDDSLCPELLGSTILKWIRKVADAEFDRSKMAWPSSQNKLWILNWAVDYTIRYRQPRDFAFVLPLREQVRERQAESRLRQGVTNSAWPERKALWTNFALATQAGDSTRMASALDAIRMDRALSDDDWGWMGPMVDANTAMLATLPFRAAAAGATSTAGGQPITFDTMRRGIQQARDHPSEFVTNHEQELAIANVLKQSLAMLNLQESVETPEQFISAARATALRNKLLDGGLLTSLPPSHATRGYRFLGYLAKADVTSAKKTALKALDEAVSHRQAHVVETWRPVCEAMEHFDGPESYEMARRLLLDKFPRMPGTEMLQAVARGDFAAAYQLARDAQAMVERTGGGTGEARMLSETVRILDGCRGGRDGEAEKWWEVLFRLFQTALDMTRGGTT